MANNPLTLGAVVSNTNPALFPGPEPLTGQYVTLERLTQNHFPDLYENVGSHDNLWAWLPDGPFSTTSDFVHWLNPHLEKSDDLVVYTVFLLSGPSKGKAVGFASLFEAHLTNRVIELGVLFGPQLQRTRAGTEVLFLLGCLLFEKLNYRRLEWKCDSLNLPSKKAAERYGFVYEGTFRQHQIVKGRNRDSCWYSMIDSEWPMCRKVFEKWLEDGNFDEQRRQRSRMEEIRESLR
jgi:RimJ/RimL family protein N-acetyltransferase